MARDVTYLLLAPYFGRNFFRKAWLAGGVDLLEVALGRDVPVGLLGGGHLLLEPVAERRGGHRRALVHPGGRPLTIERDVVAAHQHRHDEVRLGHLDLGDGRPEVTHLEREVVDVQDLAAVLLGELLDPLGGDLAVVVVGRDDVDLLAEALERERHQLVHVLGRGGAGAEAVAVAHAALVLRVVEVERVEPLEQIPGYAETGRFSLSAPQMGG